ncbi:MAG: RsmG family class I SAM-dependent methyltransferase [Acidobacteriota bacterium]
MRNDLPDRSAQQLHESLARSLGTQPPLELSERLSVHYAELKRWNRVHGLVGRNESADFVERHYAESLIGADELEGRQRLLDIGSGGGFPGLVLAAARPNLDVWLVESRGKKAAFLRATAERMGLRARCLSCRIERALPAELPEEVDSLSLRAVKLPPPVWQSLASRYGSGVRALVWAGPSEPELPSVWRFQRERRLPSGGGRRLLVYESGT